VLTILISILLENNYQSISLSDPIDSCKGNFPCKTVLCVVVLLNLSLTYLKARSQRIPSGQKRTFSTTSYEAVGRNDIFVILGTLLGYLRRRFSWSLIEVRGTHVYLRVAVWSIGFLATRTNERFGLSVDGFARRFMVSSFFSNFGFAEVSFGFSKKICKSHKTQNYFWKYSYF